MSKQKKVYINIFYVCDAKGVLDEVHIPNSFLLQSEKNLNINSTWSK